MLSFGSLHTYVCMRIEYVICITKQFIFKRKKKGWKLTKILWHVVRMPFSRKYFHNISCVYRMYREKKNTVNEHFILAAGYHNGTFSCFFLYIFCAHLKFFCILRRL